MAIVLHPSLFTLPFWIWSEENWSRIEIRARIGTHNNVCQFVLILRNIQKRLLDTIRKKNRLLDEPDIYVVVFFVCVFLFSL